MKVRLKQLIGGILVAQLWACGGGTTGPVSAEQFAPAPKAEQTFEEFKKQTYREPGEEGAYIVNGDIPIIGDEELFEFWLSRDQLRNALTINTEKGLDDKWSTTDKKNLKYCIGSGFGSKKSTVIEAMRQASDLGWETRGDVNFIHESAHDGNCTTSNTAVKFNVLPISNQPYLARAFFPSTIRSQKIVYIDDSAFSSSWPLKDILAHELGHALGFRHEHTRPESGRCIEDYDYRAVTYYDGASVMHYPQCNGTGTLKFTSRDTEGIARVYGPAPGKLAPPPGTPTPWGNRAANLTYTATTADIGKLIVLGDAPVAYHTLFTARLSGTANADLYVKFGSAPTLTSKSCASIHAVAEEECSLMTTSSHAYVAVVPKKAGSVSVTSFWTEGRALVNYEPLNVPLNLSGGITWLTSEVTSDYTLVPGTPFKAEFAVPAPTTSKMYVKWEPNASIVPCSKYYDARSGNDIVTCGFIVPAGKTKATIGVTTPTEAISGSTLLTEWVSPL